MIEKINGFNIFCDNYHFLINTYCIDAFKYIIDEYDNSGEHAKYIMNLLCENDIYYPEKLDILDEIIDK